jgi:predicted HD phosphohydrolase
MAMFTRMDHGTQADWAHIAAEHMKHQVSQAPGLVLDMLTKLKDIQVGFAADQLTHCLMTATLAQQDNAPDEEILIALCHDMGKAVSIPNHGAIAAEILKPYVSDDSYHAIKWHQHFQGAYYYQHMGKPQNMRDQFRAESWFDLGERLVDKWDMMAFDPDFQVTPLEAFEPLIVKHFSAPKQFI